MIFQADARHIPLADESVQTVITSPPYWGLRDYGIEPSVWGGDQGCEHEWGGQIILDGRQYDAKRDGNGVGQNQESQGRSAARGGFCLRCSAWLGTLGLEPTPELYVQHIVEVFREVKRVLRDDGTLWLNLGDSYISTPTGSFTHSSTLHGFGTSEKYTNTVLTQYVKKHRPQVVGLKPKDLVGIPWRVAFALQTDGWWLRSDIIWSKPNPMPESVTDRPTKAHEYLFLLAKSERYYYDAEAIKEKSINSWNNATAFCQPGTKNRLMAETNPNLYRTRGMGTNHPDIEQNGRNRRSVWTVAAQPFPEAHFATFPEDLVKPCILAGTSERGACPECGAPWERVVEKETILTRPNLSTKKQPLADTGMRNDITERFLSRPETSTKTLGWRPGCSCGTQQTKPCVVLDPFVGSGTVVKVAQDLGRIGIGLDLKPDYLNMAQRRAAQMGMMLSGR